MTQASPNARMTTLDEAGTAYWLDVLILKSGRTFNGATVVAHSEEWLLLRIEDDDTPDTWIRMDNIEEIAIGVS
jgi:hypothetical protein